MSNIYNEAVNEKIVEDLAEELGREPTESEVQTQIENRNVVPHKDIDNFDEAHAIYGLLEMPTRWEA